MNQLAHHIAEHGFHEVEAAVAELVSRIRSDHEHGTPLSADAPVEALNVLADPTQPEVARSRAFGIVALHLTRQSSGQPTDSTARSTAESIGRRRTDPAMEAATKAGAIEAAAEGAAVESAADSPRHPTRPAGERRRPRKVPSLSGG